ncbi:hypothetical protein M9Y10_041493 [Tritrichomonas musculus]|uniref:Deoxycytidine triphosphate deaminase n=1 Tax=Tritrichomonas musculus TaxID=1915356 RepID=A0ABR2K579_9EUKA
MDKIKNSGAVLTHDVILEEIKKKNIKIEPFTEDQVGCASVDLTLGKQFRRYVKRDEPIHLDKVVDYRNEDITELVEVKDGEYFVLPPFTSCLGITRETITLSPAICGLLEGRSSFARVGLIVHFTASFMMPGIKSQQVLEICNFNNRPLYLYPGTRVCQFIFLRCDGEAEYKGKFVQQKL